jgi:hypothetical protein
MGWLLLWTLRRRGGHGAKMKEAHRDSQLEDALTKLPSIKQIKSCPFRGYLADREQSCSRKDPRALAVQRHLRFNGCPWCCVCCVLVVQFGMMDQIAADRLRISFCGLVACCAGPAAKQDFGQTNTMRGSGRDRDRRSLVIIALDPIRLRVPTPPAHGRKDRGTGGEGPTRPIKRQPGRCSGSDCA